MYIENMIDNCWNGRKSYCVNGKKKFKGEEVILNAIANKMNVAGLQRETHLILELKEEIHYYIVCVNDKACMAFNKKEPNIYSNNYIGFVLLREKYGKKQMSFFKSLKKLVQKLKKLYSM